MFELKQSVLEFTAFVFLSASCLYCGQITLEPGTDLGFNTGFEHELILTDLTVIRGAYFKFLYDTGLVQIDSVRVGSAISSFVVYTQKVDALYGRITFLAAYRGVGSEQAQGGLVRIFGNTKDVEGDLRYQIVMGNVNLINENNENIPPVFIIPTIHISASGSGVSFTSMPTDRNFRLYPNPCNKYAYLSFSETNKQFKAKVFDVRGNLCTEFNLKSAANYKLDVQTFPSGQYFAVLTNDRRKFVKNFIINK